MMMLGDLVSLHSKLLCLKCYTALKLKVANFLVDSMLDRITVTKKQLQEKLLWIKLIV